MGLTVSETETKNPLPLTSEWDPDPTGVLNRIAELEARLDQIGPKQKDLAMRVKDLEEPKPLPEVVTMMNDLDRRRAYKLEFSLTAEGETRACARKAIVLSSAMGVDLVQSLLVRIGLDFTRLIRAEI